MRTFIAIDLDENIKNIISELLLKLDKGNKNIRWVKRQSMHLTLKFLGEIPDGKISNIESVLKNISEKYGAFPLCLIGTGSFPPARKNPRVLWMGIEKNEILKKLQPHLETELEKIGFPRDSRKFHPHLTLGRVRAFFNLESTLSELEKHRDTNFGEMKVKKITFFKSTLKPSGAEYSVIFESNHK